MKMRFNFDYGQKFTQEEADKMAEVVGKELKLNDESKLEYYWTDYEADLVDVYAIMPGIKLTVIGMVATTNMMQFMQKVDDLNHKLDAVVNRGQLFNEKCNVHVPGLGLLTMTEVKVEEDCCTDNLQRQLENGWRIIAACPQPDQRRPDYILGRSATE